MPGLVALYLNQPVEANQFGFPVPFKVAAEAVILEAALVVTDGGIFGGGVTVTVIGSPWWAPDAIV